MGKESDKELEKTNAGVRKKGNFEEVAEFAENVEKAMKEENLDDKAIEEFNEWRPKINEDINDVEKNTVESAVKEETRREKNYEGVKKNVEKAEKHAEKVPKKVKDRETPFREFLSLFRSLFNPLVVLGAKIFKWVQVNVYKRFMLKFNDFYFNSLEVAADLRHKREGVYDLDINFKDDSKREDLKDSIEKKQES